MKSKFIVFLKQVLTVSQFEELTNTLNISTTKLKRLLHGTDNWETIHLYNLSILTGISPADMLATCEIKQIITIDEMEALTAKWEEYVTAEMEARQ